MEFSKLKSEDKDKMNELNRKNGYGLTKKQLINLVNQHKKADEYNKALIEYRLTDINFHSDVGLLERGKYDEAMKLIEKTYAGL